MISPHRNYSYTHTAIALATLLCLVAMPARAVLLVDLTGLETDVFTPTTNSFDDDSTTRSLGGTFDADGVAITEIDLHINGFLTSSTTFRLNAFFDDLYLTGNTTEYLRESVADDYYSVTWNVRGFNDVGVADAGLSQFQTTLFKNATTVKGTTYQSGDIVFSYGVLNHAVSSPAIIVGMRDEQDNNTDAFTSGGSFTTTADFSSNFDPETQAILLRSNGGIYESSLAFISPTVIPEAGTLALTLPALAILGALAARRRIM